MTVRPLPVLAVALLLGSVAGIGVPYLPVTIFCSAVLLLLSLFVFSRAGYCEPAAACTVFAVFLFGTVSAALTQARLDVPTVLRWTGSGKVNVVGEITEPVRYGPDRATAVVSVHRIITPVRAMPIEGRLRVTIRGAIPPMFVGDIVQFETRMRPSRGLLNPGGFDYGAYLKRAGIQAIGSVAYQSDGTGVQVIARGGHALMARVDRWRGHVREATLRTLDRRSAGMYLALVTGETGYLLQDVRDSFMAAGVTHILSISGSHLGLVGVVVFWAFRRSILVLPTPWLLRLSLRVTATHVAAAATILPVTFYALLAGAEVATVRSLLMLYVFLGAVLLCRIHSVGTGLAVAFLLIVVWHPLAPLDISFQLSFLSVLAIVLLMLARHGTDKETLDPESPKAGVLAWIKKSVGDAVLVGVVVTIVTAPLVAVHFNQLARVGGFSNLLVVPFVGLLVVPLGLVACVATLVGGSNELVGGALIQPVLDTLVWIVHSFSAVPGAELRVASPSLWQVLGFYLLLGGALIWRRLWSGWFCGTLALGLLLLWIWSPRDLPGSGAVRVTFMDVGQGDAALVETSDGHTMLIDGGTASDQYDIGRMAVAPLLWDRGIRRLDVVVASHPQLDHIGGLAFIARKFNVGEFWTNGVPREVSFIRRLEEALHERRLTPRVVSDADEVVSLGGCMVRVLNPRRSTAGGFRGLTGKQQNNLSIVLRLECGGTVFLFTGDVEREAEAALAGQVGSAGSLPATVLKVPHHGARGSLHEPFLKAAHPAVAVVSVGAANRYGHPAPPMLEAYARQGIRVLRTDRDGAVTVVGTVSGIGLTCEAGRRLKMVKFGQAAAWKREAYNLERLMFGVAPCQS